MSRLPSHPSLCLALALTGLLGSCNQADKKDTGTATRDLSGQQAELDALKVKARKLEEALVESEKKSKHAPKEDRDSERMQKAILKDLDEVKEQNSDLKEELEKLRKENERLQREATAKVRTKAIGEETAELMANNGKVYRKVRIKSVDDYGVSITHEAGTATLRSGTAPADWVKRFGLIDEPVFAPENAVASADLMMTREPVVTPATPSAESPAQPKISSADSDAMMRAKFDGIMLVDGSESAASAFLAESEGEVYLYTAAHVLTGVQKLVVKNSSGATITNFGACQIATDCDLARIKVDAKPGLALKIGPPGMAGVGKEIRAVGNSAGSGVLTVLSGKVTGLGVTELEVSATVIQGNSGGPVMSADTGEVFGVVCRGEAGREDIWSSGTEFAEVRRFASRIDRPIKWRTVALDSLQGEDQRLTTFDSRTRLMFALAALEPGPSGLRLDVQAGDGKGPTILSIFTQHRNIPPIQKLIAMNVELDGRKIGTSQKDLIKRFNAYYKELIAIFATDTSRFDPGTFSFPSQKEAKQSQKWRQEATQQLQTAAARLSAR